MRHLAGTAALAAALLTSCSSGEAEPSAATVSSSPTASVIASPSTSLTPGAPPSPTPSPSPAAAVDPVLEQQVVADTTAASVEENRDALSTQLVKSNSLVQAQNDFRFDKPARALVVDVASVFQSDSRENRDALAYDLATGFAPVFWGPSATDVVRPESTVAFQVVVDDLTYSCPGTSMVALADRELSQANFLLQCAG